MITLDDISNMRDRIMSLVISQSCDFQSTLVPAV